MELQVAGLPVCEEKVRKILVTLSPATDLRLVSPSPGRTRRMLSKRQARAQAPTPQVPPQPRPQQGQRARGGSGQLVGPRGAPDGPPAVEQNP